MRRAHLWVLCLGVLGGLLYLGSLALPDARAQAVAGGDLRTGANISVGSIAASGAVEGASFASTAANMTTGFALQTLSGSTEGTDFRGMIRPTSDGARARRITCTIGTSGTVGAATTGLVFTLRNRSDSTDLCSCTVSAAACATSANGGMSCDCNGVLAAGKMYSLRLATTTDCGTNPSDFWCQIEVAR